jgi:hypothetical protein
MANGWVELNAVVRVREDELLAAVTRLLEGRPAPKAKPRPVEPSRTAPIWAAYSGAYLARHGAAPTRNGVVNKQLQTFLSRVPEAEAPEIAAFYVSHNDSYYVRARHSVGRLVRDAEKIRTEWLTGERMTATKAHQADKKQSSYDSWAPLLEEAAKREGERG